MNRLTSLLTELQNLDMRIDENAAVRAALQAKLADSTALTTARASLTETEKIDSELKAGLRSLELETASLAAKLAQVSERLYSGRITNAKELDGLNQDEKMLQKRKGELEDRELSLMEQIETADESLKEKQTAFEQISAQTEKQNTQARTALIELKDALDALTNKRAALAADLPVETLRIYDDLRQIKKGRAVTQMKNNACGACGYEVPSGLRARVQAGTELVFCSNCGRIITP